MLLEALRYIRLEGKAKEWSIIGKDEGPVRFGNLNLLVGKNASGKSRTLSVLREIAGLFAGSHPLSEATYPSAKYQLFFKDGNDEYEYFIDYRDKLVEEEYIKYNGSYWVDRKNNLIYSETSGKMEPFDIINEQSLSISLHGNKDYPYLKKFFFWGLNLKLAAFTNQIEKNFLLDDMSQLENPSLKMLRVSLSLLSVFWRGKQQFGNEFIGNIIKNMNSLGYPLEEIDIKKGKSGYGLYVKEEELDEMTSQIEMSQGMYRSLSWIIQLNYALMNKFSVCILIDDLGEGLDFDRSRAIIRLLVKSIENSNIQIFITTNDRYIMNKIPLKYWSVIERYPKKSVFYNYCNSKETFDDFKYTGLNNFDFLATDFYIKGFNDNTGE